MAFCSSGARSTLVRRSDRGASLHRPLTADRDPTAGRTVALGCMHINPLKSIQPVSMDEFVLDEDDIAKVFSRRRARCSALLTARAPAAGKRGRCYRARL